MKQKTEKISIRISPRMYAAIRAQARAEHMTLSAFVCCRLRDYTNRKQKTETRGVQDV